jgi:hypothetical protein
VACRHPVDEIYRRSVLGILPLLQRVGSLHPGRIGSIVPTARHRVMDLRKSISGSYYNRIAVPTTITSSALTGPMWTTDDTIGNKNIITHLYNDNGFLSINDVVAVPTIEGEKYVVLSGVPTLDRKLSGWPAGFHPVPQSTAAVFPVPNSTALSNYAYSIIAGTNINVAHVSVPTFVGELRDIPGLFRDYGRSIFKQIARLHLEWRWAIKPLMRDLTKMCEFAAVANAKAMDIKRLSEGGVLRKRVGLSQQSIFVDGGQVILNSVGALIFAQKTTTYTSKVWGTARWKLHPSATLPRVHRWTKTGRIKAFGRTSAFLDLAHNMTIGRTSYEYLTTAWELLPWSWFVDWFTNFGSVIQGANNTIPMTWSNLCLMRTLTSRTEYSVRTGPPSDTWATVVGPNYQEQVRKERYASVAPIGPPVVPTLVPLLNGKTWSILGSIAILRNKRSR